MARPPAEDVTNTELTILQVLWDQGESTRRQVADVVYPGGGEAHYATVQNLLGRLERKGFVRSNRGGNVLVFTATVDRDELIRRRLQVLADKLCGGAAAPLIMNLVRSQPLSAAEVEQLSTFLREQRAAASSPGVTSRERGVAVDAILYAGLNNAAWTVILALAAAAGARWWRSLPAVGHALWLMVLLKLVTPSVLQFSLPHTDLRTRDARALIAPLEPLGLAPRVRPSVDLGPAVSERVTRRDGRPPEASHQRAVTRSPEASRPLVPGRPARWEFTSKTTVPALALSWLVGAVAWWSVVGLNSARFRRMIRSARPAPAELRQRIGRVAERLGLRNIPMACLLPVRMSPMVWVPLAGPPHLVLPEELWGLLDATQQDAILAHELAHLKRRDHWVRRLEALACGLYWWDPVAWWARREVERAEERCCDAWVLWALPTAAGAYAEALVMTAVYLSGPRQPLPLGASGVGRISPLKGRLQMILSDPTTVSIKRTAPWALLVLGALSLPFLPAADLGEALRSQRPRSRRSRPRREISRPRP